MTCTFYHEGLRDCTCSYCYYPKSGEITCPIKTQHIEKIGVVYRESPDSQTVTQQMQQRRYPKQY